MSTVQSNFLALLPTSAHMRDDVLRAVLLENNLRKFDHVIEQEEPWIYFQR